MTGKKSSGLAQSVQEHLIAYFDAHEGTDPAPGLYDRVLQEVERPLLTLVMTSANGNQTKAAEILGLNRNTLRKKLKDLKILTDRC